MPARSQTSRIFYLPPNEVFAAAEEPYARGRMGLSRAKGDFACFLPHFRRWFRRCWSFSASDFRISGLRTGWRRIEETLVVPLLGDRVLRNDDFSFGTLSVTQKVDRAARAHLACRSLSDGKCAMHRTLESARRKSAANFTPREGVRRRDGGREKTARCGSL